MFKWRIKKGDTVMITTGKDKGKIGEITSILRDKNQVTVKNAKIVKRHQRPSTSNVNGVIEKESPIHISNVMHIDPKDNKATRIGTKVLDNGVKIRYAKRSGEKIE